MSTLNTAVQVVTLSQILALIDPDYATDRVGTDFEMVSYSPFPFHGMKA